MTGRVAVLLALLVAVTLLLAMAGNGHLELLRDYYIGPTEGIGQ